MYVLGGRVGDDDEDNDIRFGADEDATASVLKFDSTQGHWRQVSPMPEPRYNFAACAVGSDVFVFGGKNEVSSIQASVFKYDTEANIWSTLALMPHYAFGHSASVLDNLIYIVGAGDHRSGVQRFDPISGAWTTLTPTLTHNLYASSFVLEGCLHVAGGLPHSSHSKVERYDAANNTWASVAYMLEGRRSFGSVTIGSMGPAEAQDLFDALIVKAACSSRS
jgi:hypothetical protein